MSRRARPARSLSSRSARPNPVRAGAQLRIDPIVQRVMRERGVGSLDQILTPSEAVAIDAALAEGAHASVELAHWQHEDGSADSAGAVALTVWGTGAYPVTRAAFAPIASHDPRNYGPDKWLDASGAHGVYFRRVAPLPQRAPRANPRARPNPRRPKPSPRRSRRNPEGAVAVTPAAQRWLDSFSTPLSALLSEDEQVVLDAALARGGELGVDTALVENSDGASEHVLLLSLRAVPQPRDRARWVVATLENHGWRYFGLPRRWIRHVRGRDVPGVYDHVRGNPRLNPAPVDPNAGAVVVYPGAAERLAAWGVSPAQLLDLQPDDVRVAIDRVLERGGRLLMLGARDVHGDPIDTIALDLQVPDPGGAMPDPLDDEQALLAPYDWKFSGPYTGWYKRVYRPSAALLRDNPSRAARSRRPRRNPGAPDVALQPEARAALAARGVGLSELLDDAEADAVAGALARGAKLGVFGPDVLTGPDTLELRLEWPYRTEPDATDRARLTDAGWRWRTVGGDAPAWSAAPPWRRLAVRLVALKPTRANPRRAGRDARRRNRPTGRRNPAEGALVEIDPRAADLLWYAGVDDPRTLLTEDELVDLDEALSLGFGARLSRYFESYDENPAILQLLLSTDHPATPPQEAFAKRALGRSRGARDGAGRRWHRSGRRMTAAPTEWPWDLALDLPLAPTAAARRANPARRRARRNPDDVTPEQRLEAIFADAALMSMVETAQRTPYPYEQRAAWAVVQDYLEEVHGVPRDAVPARAPAAWMSSANLARDVAERARLPTRRVIPLNVRGGVIDPESRGTDLPYRDVLLGQTRVAGRDVGVWLLAADVPWWSDNVRATRTNPRGRAAGRSRRNPRGAPARPSHAGPALPYDAVDIDPAARDLLAAHGLDAMDLLSPRERALLAESLRYGAEHRVWAGQDTQGDQGVVLHVAFPPDAVAWHADDREHARLLVREFGRAGWHAYEAHLQASRFARVP